MNKIVLAIVMIAIAVIVIGLYVYLKNKELQTAKDNFYNLQNSLVEGAKVETRGGLVGTIKKLDKNYVELEIAKNTVVKVNRSAIILIYKD